MDPITHGLLGATIAKVITGKRLPRGAALIGGLAAMAPDVDVFMPSFGDPTAEWVYHRSITHGLIVIPLGGLLCALPFLLSARFKPYRWAVMLAATLGYGSHTMLDSLTNYGTQQLRPFADTRVTWDAMPIVDPLYSLMLMAGLCLMSRWANAIRWSLALSLLYVAFGFWQHHRAVNVQHALLAMRKQQATQARVLPMPGWLVFWRSLYVADGKVHADGIQLPWFSPPRVLLGHAADAITFSSLPAAAQANAETVRRFKVLEWFSGGYLAAVEGLPNTIGDQRLTGEIESLKPLWGLQLDETGAARGWKTSHAGFETLVGGLFFGDARFQPLPRQSDD
jgi:inner membrane protein